MSSASSNQSVDCDGVDYEDVYPSGHIDQESSGEDRSTSASSSSSTNEDTEMAEPIEISDNGEEQPLRSIISANGLREFIMLPEWTVNNFISTTSKPLGKITRSQRTSPSVCPINPRNATMMAWRVLVYTNRC